MNTTITKIINTNIKGQIEFFNSHSIEIPPICLAGPPGIGKTAGMKLIAEQLDMGLVHQSIPELTTESLSGIPNFIKAPHLTEYHQNKGAETLATNWSAPELIAQVNKAAEEHPNGAILFLDDIHRINMSLLPYLYGLLGERKLGQFVLSPKVAIVGAMNDSTEAGFSGMDSPIKDRISIMPVSFDFEYWFKHFGSRLNYYISSFIRLYSHYCQEEESTEIEQFGTPRSWTHLANELSLFDKDFILENCELLAKQKVSTEAAKELSKHINYITAIDFSGIIKSQTMLDINNMKSIDQMLYGYIVNETVTVADALYIIDLINNNMESSNFIGFIAGDIYAKYQMHEAGKKINDGPLFLAHIMMSKPFNPSNYKSSIPADIQTAAKAATFTDAGKLFGLANEFIN
jgi:hypothetical protein